MGGEIKTCWQPKEKYLPTGKLWLRLANVCPAGETSSEGHFCFGSLPVLPVHSLHGMYLCVCVFVCGGILLCICVCSFVCLCVLPVCLVCVRRCVCVWYVCVCMSVSIYVHVHLCVFACICVSLCLSLCVNAHAHWVMGMKGKEKIFVSAHPVRLLRRSFHTFHGYWNKAIGCHEINVESIQPLVLPAKKLGLSLWMCPCMYIGAHWPQHWCGGQRTTPSGRLHILPCLRCCPWSVLWTDQAVWPTHFQGFSWLCPILP